MCDSWRWHEPWLNAGAHFHAGSSPRDTFRPSYPRVSCPGIQPTAAGKRVFRFAAADSHPRGERGVNLPFVESSEAKDRLLSHWLRTGSLGGGLAPRTWRSSRADWHGLTFGLSL